MDTPLASKFAAQCSMGVLTLRPRTRASRPWAQQPLPVLLGPSATRISQKSSCPRNSAPGQFLMSDNYFDSPDTSLYEVHASAPGPQGTLPLTEAMLRERPSG